MNRQAHNREGVRFKFLGEFSTWFIYGLSKPRSRGFPEGLLDRLFYSQEIESAIRLARFNALPD